MHSINCFIVTVGFKYSRKLNYLKYYKLLPSLSGKQLVDRLPIIISNKGLEQLLSVLKLISGTGENQATLVYQALKNWGLTDNIQALCCDINASNTGRLKGACIILEQK